MKSAELKSSTTVSERDDDCSISFQKSFRSMPAMRYVVLVTGMYVLVLVPGDDGNRFNSLVASALVLVVVCCFLFGRYLVLLACTTGGSGAENM